MRKVLYTLFFAFFVLVLFLFKPRQDLVFGAINETQYIRLFEKGREFVLCVKDNNSYRGTYTISKDTVFLSYREDMQPFVTSLKDDQTKDGLILPSRLHITKSSSQIKSTDNTQFSAQIYLDMRQKVQNPSPVNSRFLNSQTAKISAMGH